VSTNQEDSDLLAANGSALYCSAFAPSPAPLLSYGVPLLPSHATEQAAFQLEAVVGTSGRRFEEYIKHPSAVSRRARIDGGG